MNERNERIFFILLIEFVHAMRSNVLKKLKLTYVFFFPCCIIKSELHILFLIPSNMPKRKSVPSSVSGGADTKKRCAPKSTPKVDSKPVVEEVSASVVSKQVKEVTTKCGSRGDSSKPPLTRFLRMILSGLYGKGASITCKGLYTVESLVYECVLRFLRTTKRHLESARKTTLQLKDMDTCVIRTFESLAAESRVPDANLFVEELVNYSLTCGSEAVKQFQNRKKELTQESQKKSQKQSQVDRAGIVLPPVRIRRFVKQQMPNYRFSEDAIVFLSAVMEYVAARVLQMAHEITLSRKRKRITPDHLISAVSKDKVLNTLLQS